MCARLDRRAVYLGRPAAGQRCPANLIGRRRAILVEPEANRRGGPGAAAFAARAAGASASTGATFTGLGFDTCSAPSAKEMAAWSASPYRAVGVYIGGINSACSQPNLTPSWVSDQTLAGWRLIPTYVGLQAPTSSCSSCAKLSAGKASAQGSEAAADAVAQASALGMGPGSPIYFDMESYTRAASASGATLAFLEAWTTKLRALGYLSGVYSSSDSGIVDLSGALGGGYQEPDDLWIANWNGEQNTADPNVPAAAWSQRQRVHQYRGGHEESYGGATLDIDSDYVDGSTVGTASPVGGAEDPVGALELAGSPSPGQVRVRGWAFDPDAPTQALAIRAIVGGRAGASGAQEIELGTIATSPRREVGAKHPAAGMDHGFDASFAAFKYGPQPVCVYALNAGPGADALLGCKTIVIGVAIVLSHLRATKAGVHVRVACRWPLGTTCPGQLLLRARIEVTARGRRGRRSQVLTRSLGRRGFHLGGHRARGFRLPYSPYGRRLLRLRGRLRAQLVAAIPGGHRIHTLGVGR
jgi:Rv2525c-like, glycoside hydrolase-like domain